MEMQNKSKSENSRFGFIEFANEKCSMPLAALRVILFSHSPKGPENLISTVYRSTR